MARSDKNVCFTDAKEFRKFPNYFKDSFSPSDFFVLDAKVKI